MTRDFKDIKLIIMEEQAPRHCCQARARAASCNFKRWSWNHLLIAAVCLLSLVKSSLQAEYSFTGEPPGFYYIRDGAFAVLPCAAELTLEDGTVQPVSPAILVNSEPLDSRIHTRFIAELSNSVVVGIFLFGIEASDNGTVLECVVRDGDSTVLSASTQLHVGDGRPLRPLMDPVVNDEGLYSLTVTWGVARTPEFSPILHYTVQLIELLEVETEILFNATTNNTNAVVTGLRPRTMYRIYVYGVNDIGPGVRSDYVVGMTASPVVPLPPSQVTVDTRKRGSECDVILSWTPTPIEPDLMTPITHYVIYYGRDENTLFNSSTDNPTVTTVSMSGWAEGAWLVGVASANSAGVSTFELKNIVIEAATQSPDETTDPLQSTTPSQSTQETTEPSNPSSPPLNLTVIIAIAGGIFVLLLAILIIIIIILVVHYRRKSYNQPENTYDLRTGNMPIEELDGSPEVKRRNSKSYSPRHKANRESILSYNYMNNEYESEPHRAGSTPPRV